MCIHLQKLHRLQQEQLSSRMSETKHVNTDPSALGALAAAINKGDSPVLGTFTVVTPLAKQGNVYEGILKYKTASFIAIKRAFGPVYLSSKRLICKTSL